MTDNLRDDSPFVIPCGGTIWDFPTPLRPVEDDLPLITAPRGGITFTLTGPYSTRPPVSPMRRRWLQAKHRVMRPWVYRLRSTYTHWRDYYKEDDEW